MSEVSPIWTLKNQEEVIIGDVVALVYGPDATGEIVGVSHSLLPVVKHLQGWKAGSSEPFAVEDILSKLRPMTLSEVKR